MCSQHRHGSRQKTAALLVAPAGESRLDTSHPGGLRSEAARLSPWWRSVGCLHEDRRSPPEECFPNLPPGWLRGKKRYPSYLVRNRGLVPATIRMAQVSIDHETLGTSCARL